MTLRSAGGRMMASGPRQIAVVQLLRAFAALMVVAYHSLGLAGRPFMVGAAGVDVFFVISGFIMWTVASRRHAAPLRFAWNRVARIVPVYWLVTLAIAALASLVPAAMPNLEPTAERVLLSLFFIPHFDQSGSIWPMLTPGWTLNYEMFFYALFAAALALPRAFQLAAMSLAMAALVLAGAVFAPAGAVAATYTNPLLLEFLAGVWLGWGWSQDRLPGRAAGWTMLALGLAALVALEATGTHPDTGNPDIWRVALYGVPAFLVVAGALAAAPAAGANSAALALGDASYSIYLLHAPLVRLIWRVTGWLPMPAYLAVCFAVSTAAGLVCYSALERPLTAALKKWPVPQRAREA